VHHKSRLPGMNRSGLTEHIAGAMPTFHSQQANVRHVSLASMKLYERTSLRTESSFSSNIASRPSSLVVPA
jgi:hypothetical protein